LYHGSIKNTENIKRFKKNKVHGICFQIYSFGKK